MEKELILKERETLDVLKELESTKRLVENLRSRLQTEESEVKKLNIQMSVCVIAHHLSKRMTKKKIRKTRESCHSAFK